MPRINNLTEAGRRKGREKSQKIAADRKATRQAKVKVMVAEKKPKTEIARLLKVRPETISRDCKALGI